MISVPPPGARARVWDTPAGLLVVIPARTSWFGVLFLGVWLLGWAMGEVAAVRHLWGGGDPGPTDLFMLAWLVGWSVAGAVALYNLLWQLLGQERILLSHDALTLRRVVLGVGLPSRFELPRLSGLRVAGSEHGGRRAGRLYSPLAGTDGVIALDTGAATIRFGLELDEAEAGWIVSELRARHPFPAIIG